MNEAVLFVADSGRQVAGQARYARMPMIVVDRFADEDTRASAWRTHRMERNDSSEAPEWADRYGKTLRRLSFMAGGGLESSMDMIDDLSARGEWLGSPPSAWRIPQVILFGCVIFCAPSVWLCRPSAAHRSEVTGWPSVRTAAAVYMCVIMQAAPPIPDGICSAGCGGRVGP